MSETAKANVKSDYSQLPQSADHGEILKQVEFYFSDNNLPFDKFLWTETSKNDGWIPIATIHSFKRMRRFQPLEEVVAALRESPALLEVSEDGEKVRRKTALQLPAAEDNKNRFARTVYAKGFGEEAPTSQVDIEKFFTAHGPVNQVRLRRTDDGTFKESVFVEFQNLEDAKKFVAQDPKPSYGGHELLVMSKEAYVEMKSEQHNFADRANGRKKPKFNAYKELRSREQREKRGSRFSRRDNGHNKRRRDDDAPDAKKSRRHDASEDSGSAPEAADQPAAPEPSAAGQPAKEPEADKPQPSTA